MSLPTPLLLLLIALAVVAVVVLWKLLMVAGLIGLAQWAVTTQTEDPTVLLIAYGLPALLVTVLCRRRAAARTGHRAGLFPRSARRLEVSR
ncbi:hypothetical protein ADK67_05485 [Saccharothrix sp. NRRL B-16348]|uniref:hypothetical protein n=1 Tax=Saccharothrix sp. NRRL B-16348 TaxID=1415542 RepID=UPI0006AFAA3B|nr:hypothetical protein [Saccharothrix sp. NRRL B-16348]KOX33789.1 hypothetical protein ADK67_05485 [Saccharothrix sp. NRRL B-16348]